MLWKKGEGEEKTWSSSDKKSAVRKPDLVLVTAGGETKNEDLYHKTGQLHQQQQQHHQQQQQQ